MRDHVCGRTVRSTLFAALLAALGPVAGHATDHSGGTARQDAYALVRGGRWSSTNCSLKELRGLSLRLSGDFLWFRRSGNGYVLRDPTVLQQAFSLFAPLHDLEPEQSALEGKQRRLDAEERALDGEQEELDRWADRRSHADDGNAGQVARRQRGVETRLRALETEERRLEETERSLDEREDAIERAAEAELWRLIDRALSAGLARPDPRR